MIEKTARTPSSDPIQERLRQNKATWNKDVSVFINDLIHLKKTMNGWPSKFFKERSRIVDPIPADPATIIGSLSGDFQDLAQRGQSIVQEQLNYVKNRRQKQPKSPTETAPTPSDLSKQLAAWEQKYGVQLVAEGSNPITRFITKLLTPTIGFGEAARIRRLRMTLLNACARTLSDLKALQAEIVKSSKISVENSHKIMNSVMNHWSIVARSFAAFKTIKPEPIVDAGGELQTPGEKEKQLEQPEREEQKKSLERQPKQEKLLEQMKKTPEVAAEKTAEVIVQAQLKRWLGKTRHQLLPGSTSGSRLEIYRLIDSLKQDLNEVMNLLEKGLDVEPLNMAINQVNREMTSLRAMVRSLYYFEKPETIPQAFF